MPFELVSHPAGAVPVGAGRSVMPCAAAEVNIDRGAKIWSFILKLNLISIESLFSMMESTPSKLTL